MFYQNENIARPYFYSTFNTSSGDKVQTRSFWGVGINNLNQANVTIGSDAVFVGDKISTFVGVGIRFLGYSSMGKDYLFDPRLGIEIGRFQFVGTVNWSYETLIVDIPSSNTRFLSYMNDNSRIVVKKPINHLTVGIFYSL